MLGKEKDIVMQIRKRESNTESMIRISQKETCEKILFRDFSILGQI